MRNIIIHFIASFVIIQANAQNISDVVRWSSIDQIGTARTLGVGSAFGAMGGDFSVININPAGIADFRVSEFTFTPSLRGFRTDAWFKKDSLNNQLSKGSGFGLDNIGFVIASNPNSSWTSSNFAIGFSRIADFRRNVLISGKIPGSITTYFAEKANGKTEAELDDFIAYPAYNTGAIFDFSGSKNYETDFDFPNQEVDRTQDLFQTGGINEITMGWAGEYKNQLNLGLSMGVPIVSFEEQKTYVEDDKTDEISVFDRLEYIERLNTSGVGINFKAGFTYKIKNQVRIAGAFHSPTWYRFTDDYSTSMEYAFTDGNGSQRYDYTSPDGTFEYKISTPWRAIGSIGTTYRVGEIRGFVNADVEYLDYTNANYNGTAFDSSIEEQQWTNEVNRDILKRLGNATNIRLGTEFGYKNLRVRAGYSFEQSPFNADTKRNNKTSFGIGFREDRFFIDLGFRIAEYVEGYNPYIVLDSELDPLANISTRRTRSALTLGFKF
jgi:long-subunit fatty acid transport protein